MIMMGLPINNPVSGVFDGCDYDRNIAVNHAVQLVVFVEPHSRVLEYWELGNTVPKKSHPPS